MGGGIFVNTDGGGSLNIAGPLTLSGGSISPGTGYGGNGAAVSTGIFLKGAGPLIFSPGIGQLVTISDSIGDNNIFTLTGATYNAGEGPGVALIKTGAGKVQLYGVNTYAGGTTLDGGVLAINTDSSLGDPSTGIDVIGDSTLELVTSFTSSARTITITNSTLTIDTTDLTTSWNGDIGGNGSLTKYGAGTLNLTQDNSYTGGTTVNDGTLFVSFPPANTLSFLTVNGPGIYDFSTASDVTVGNFSGRDHGTVNMGANSLTVGTSNSTSYSGIITGTGSFTKQGSGALTLSGINTFTGNTNVNDGTLILLGKVSGNALVSIGATLAGDGTVGGNLTSSGTVAPSPGIATLTVAGNYIQTSTGTYSVVVDNLGDSTLLAIGGTASLSGTLATATTNGVEIFKDYLIMTADGGVSGTFTLTNGVPATIDFVRYEKYAVYLSFRQKIVPVAITPNQIGVAVQLDSITSPNTCELNLLNNITGLSQAEIPNALDELSGEQYTYLLQMSRYGNERFNRRIYNATRSFVSPCTCMYQPIQAWVQIEEGHSFGKGNSNSAGMKSQNWDSSAGLFAVFDNFLFGVAGNYQVDHMRFNQGGHSDWQTAQGAIYGAYQHECGYGFFDAMYGGSWGKFHRKIDINALHATAKSRPETNQGLIYAEVGANLQCCDILIQPFVAYEYNCMRQESFRERGADCLDLAICKKDYRTNDTYIGTHLTTCCDCITLYGDIAWQYRYSDTAVTIHNAFRQFGSSFPIKGATFGNQGIVGSLNASINIYENVTISATLSGEKWKRWSGYGINLGVNICW